MFSEKDIAALTMINSYVDRTFTLLEKISLGELELRKQMAQGCDPQFAQVRMAEIAASKELALAYFALLNNIADKMFAAFMKHEETREARLADTQAERQSKEIAQLRNTLGDLDFQVSELKAARKVNGVENSVW